MLCVHCAVVDYAGELGEHLARLGTSYQHLFHCPFSGGDEYLQSIKSPFISQLKCRIAQNRLQLYKELLHEKQLPLDITQYPQLRENLV